MATGSKRTALELDANAGLAVKRGKMREIELEAWEPTSYQPPLRMHAQLTIIILSQLAC